MFDDLDDPAFTGPRPGTREAVLARAGRIRRNRQLAATAGAASFVVLLVGGALGARAMRTDGISGIEPVASASASPTPQDSPTPTASPTPSPTATSRPATTPSPEPQPPVIVGPTARATPARQPEVDVVSEWLGMSAIDSCRPATALPPRPGAMDASGVSMTLDVPAEVDGTKPPVARIVVTNDTDHIVWFSYLGSGGGPVHTIAGANGGYSGETYQDRISRETYGAGAMELQPGETGTIDATFLTDTCAEGRTTAKRNRPTLLAPGTYQVSAGIMVTDTMYWSPEGTGSPSPSASPTGAFRPDVYSTVPVTVTVR